MRSWMAIGAFTLTSLLSAAAVAQSSEEEARQAFTQAQQYTAANQWTEALELFRRANQLAPASPAPLLGIGLCLTELGQPREALEMLDRYLDQGRNRDSRRQAQDMIDRNLRALGMGTIQIRVEPSTATVTVDGQSIPVHRLDRVRVAAGTHQVAAQASGYGTAERSVQVSTGREERVTLAVQQGAVSTAPSTGRRSIARQWWFWTIIGLVVIGGVTTGLVLGLQDRPPDGGSFDWRVDLP